MTPEPAAWERGSPQEYEKVLRRVAASLTPKGGSVPKADIVLCFLTGRTLYGMALPSNGNLAPCNSVVCCLVVT